MPSFYQFCPEFCQDFLFGGGTFFLFHRQLRSDYGARELKITD